MIQRLSRIVSTKAYGLERSNWGRCNTFVTLHKSLAQVEPGIVSPPRTVPTHIPRPFYSETGEMSNNIPYIPILDPSQQKRLRRACELAKEILAFASKQIAVGITTDEIDSLVHDEIIRHGAYPSPLNYGGFPKSLCTSVNEVVVHGIPDSRALEDGDIVNLDVSVYLDGYHGDTSNTFLVGNVDIEGQQLVKTTQTVLSDVITNVCKPLAKISDIGDYIQSFAERKGYSVNEEFAGHGIGTEFHCSPYIVHVRNPERAKMLPGMAFTIEPALCVGKPQTCYWEDGWTVATLDGKRSAQSEHTVLVTEDGVDILT